MAQEDRSHDGMPEIDNLHELTNLLRNANPDEREALAKILNCPGEIAPKQLSDRFIRLRSGIIGQIFAGYDYKRLVTDVADHLDIKWEPLLNGREWSQIPSSEIETAIVAEAFRKMWSNLTHEQQERLAKDLAEKSGDPDFTKHVIAGGALFLAGLGGFQIYLLASTLVGGLTSLLGITLPFVVYTTMSRIIGIALGPAGWGLLAASILWECTRASWSRLIPGIVFVAYIRHRISTKQGLPS
ncbi:MAG: hypothetical protein LBK99_03490 [Opitutaceae bacterium]|jgi:uncharacterized protein YaaW (UPF0174 family)|nr:hypothetical protein [Opitutaceae bacterium]